MLKYLKAARTILGMNARNLAYTLPDNPKEARAIADNKLRAKRFLKKEDILTPETYGIIRSKQALDTFDWNSLPSSFVLKPNKGFGGQGILIVYGEKKRKDANEEREWIQSDGRRIKKDFLYNHIVNILEGSFSLKNAPDKAYFEQRLRNIQELKPFLYKGVPDVRIIVHNRIPMMAELRLPTRESNGKANLHAGGVGVGIDIASGITTVAIQHDRVIEEHPDTKRPLSGFTIPHWNQILEMAVRAQAVTGLGYAGVDIALDKDLGPVLLELNARPGLAIQIANTDGLSERLDRVKRLKIKTTKRGIRVAKELFGGEVEEEVETILGKKIIGLHTKVTFLSKDGTTHTVEAKIDTGATYSSIDRDLAIELGYKEALTFFDKHQVANPPSYEKAKEIYHSNRDLIRSAHKDIYDIDLIKSSSGTTIRPAIQIPMEIEGVNKTGRITIIDRKNLTYPALIGTRDLSNFIIDTKKLS